MHDTRMKEQLEQFAQKNVPEVNLLPRVLQRIATQPAAPRWRFSAFLPAGWVGAAVILLVVLTATAYAAGPAVRRLMQWDADMQGVDPLKEDGQTLALTQKVGPVSVEVEWAYADESRVLVGYSVRSDDGKRYDPAGVVLTDGAGNELRQVGGYGVVGHSDVLEVELPAGEGSWLQPFEYAGRAPAVGQTLGLHFKVEVVELILPRETAAPAATADPRGAQSASAEAQLAQMGEKVGPFEFDFSLPVKAKAPPR